MLKMKRFLPKLNVLFTCICFSYHYTNCMYTCIHTHNTNRKLTLQSLHWALFEKPEEHEANCRSFIQLIQEQLSLQGVSSGPTVCESLANDPFTCSLSLSLSLSLHSLLPYLQRVSPAPGEASIDKSRTIIRRGGRLNTKLRAQTTIKDIGVEENIDTFWDRNFPEEDEVPWYKFQQGFLKDYEAQLTGGRSFLCAG